MNNKYIKIGITVCVAVCAVMLLSAWIAVIMEYALADNTISLTEGDDLADTLFLIKQFYLAIIITVPMLMACSVFSILSHNRPFGRIVKIITASLGAILFAAAAAFAGVVRTYMFGSDYLTAIEAPVIAAFQSEMIPVMISCAVIAAAEIFCIFIKKPEVSCEDKGVQS